MNHAPMGAYVPVPSNTDTGAPETPTPTASSRTTEYPAHEGVPRKKNTQLAQVMLGESRARKKRELSPLGAELSVEGASSRPAFPSVENAKEADSRLQRTLARWLVTGRLNGNPVPQHSSIKPFAETFSEAVRDPKVRAWFESKGLDLSTVRVFNDGVDGTVVVNGEKVTQRFTTTDGSGWWEVGAKVSEAVNTLCSDYSGVLLPDEKTGGFRDVRVVLGFYGVAAPSDPANGAQVGRTLQQDGWPPISGEKRAHWQQQFEQLIQKGSDSDMRPKLASQLQSLVKDKADGHVLNLSDERMVIGPESTLAKKSQMPRERLTQWLNTSAFQAFIKKIGVDGVDNVYRVSNGGLEILGATHQWSTLQPSLQDEIKKVQAEGSEEEKTAIEALSAEFDQLVELSKATGNALCSGPIYDVRQFLAFSGLGAPTSVAQVNSAIGWLNNTLPPAPIGGDYAALSPYVWGPGALSATDLALLRTKSVGPGSVHELLRRHPFPEGMPDDHPLKLQQFFDSPTATAKAQELAKVLNMAEVADGKPLSRATRHQLLATAIKAGITAELPGKPGVVAGHLIYRASNLGRSLDEERKAIEAHLKGKGADAKTAPLIAHLFLAQAAPEFLIKPDPHVPDQAPGGLRLSPGQVGIGSTSWLNLRLACAMTEKLAGAGSSRSLNVTEAYALARLNPMVVEQEQLIKSLGAQPVLDWAVMTGVIPRSADGRYTPEHYSAATQAFVDREAATGKAFEAMTSEPPNQTNLLIEHLALLFPEMTREEIRNFRLKHKEVSLLPLAPTLLNESKPLLTDVILHQQAPSEPLAVLLPTVVNLLKPPSDYTFVHEKISQETFNERINQLPSIASLVEPAVDKYSADMRSAHETVVKQMIANAPLDVRRILEVADIQVFSLREATGQNLDEDSYDPSSVAAKVGRGGVLVRYDTKTTSPTGGYFEFFPNSMKIVRRDDLRNSLKGYNGEVKERQTPFKRESYRTGVLESFDFEAYKTGGEPRPSIRSQVILEKAGAALPGLGLVNWPAPASDYVPNSWASDKTSAIAERVASVTFEEKREQLIEHANEPTDYHKIRNFPFSSSKVFSKLNFRMVLSMIPFVGAVADIVEGKVGDGVKGLLIDFASFVATGGVAGAKTFFKGLKVLVPFGNRAFAMRPPRGTVPFLRSLFNPLDGSVGVIKTAQRALAGKFVAAGPGMFITVTAFEKCRWGAGVYDQLQANAADNATYPGSRLGVSQDCTLYAVQKGAAWYAIDPITHKPTGAPLTDFTPEPLAA